MSAAASSAAAKVAPRSLNQFRNFSYIVVAWLGFNKGYRQKRDNDALWVGYQQQVRKQNAARQEAEHASAAARLPKAGVPEIVPEDLRPVYEELSQSIQ